MTTPAIIYIVLQAIGLLLNAHDHGKPRTPTNFWTAFVGSIISIGLLVWGGFFN